MHFSCVRWSPALILLLVAAPMALAKGCPAEDPCAIAVVLTDEGLSASPTDLATEATYVLAVRPHATRAGNVSLDGTPLRLVVPPSDAAIPDVVSDPFQLGAGTFTLREEATNATVFLQVAAPGEPAVNPLAIALPVVVGLALFAIAGLVARHGSKHRHNRMFSALFFLSGIKSVSEGLVLVAGQSTAAWTLLAQLCGLGMLPLLFLFLVSFPRPAPWMVRSPGLGSLAFVPSFAVLAVLLLQPGSDTFYGVIVAFNVLSTGMTLAALILLLRTRRHSPDAIERTQASFVALGFLPSFVATWVISALFMAGVAGVVDPGLAQGWINVVLRYLSPVFEFLAAGLVGFAILKYNILGVSPRFRVGVKSVLVGTLFATVFLLTQFVENVVLQGQLFSFADNYTGGYGSFVLSGVSGLVLFKPIESVSTKVADRLLPARTDALSRAGEVYHAQCTYVLRDGNVSDRELAFLHNLRAQLGLSEAEARGIEEKVERLLRVDAPQTGATAGTAVRHVAAAHGEVAAKAPDVRRASALPGRGGPAAVRSTSAPPAAGNTRPPGIRRPPAGKPPAGAPTRRPPAKGP